MGGTSVLHGNMYMRGNAKDYEEITASGLRGWSWDEVLPYFKKSENNMDFEQIKGYKQDSDEVRCWLVNSTLCFTLGCQHGDTMFSCSLNGSLDCTIGYKEEGLFTLSEVGRKTSAQLHPFYLYYRKCNIF